MRRRYHNALKTKKSLTAKIRKKVSRQRTTCCNKETNSQEEPRPEGMKVITATIVRL